MNTGAAEVWLRQQISTIYDTREAASIASMVMESITGWSRLERVSRREEPLLVNQLHRLTECEQRLLKHEPVQYVLQEAWFYGMKLYVDGHVLIPRPETEELAHWILSDVKASGKNVFEKKATQADETRHLKILDVGTGSGCIALALKKAMPLAEVWGCDVSEEALNVARQNGSSLDIRVDFVGVDFLDEAQCRQLPMVDIIVSNPPYIPQSDRASMQANVLDFEPHRALFVPNERPLLFYEALARFGREHLHPAGSIYAEIHEDLGPQVADLFEKEGYEVVELKKDMQGKDRMVKAFLNRQ